MRQDLEAIRERGWTVVDQELEEGLRSIAAPIPDPTGRTVAAVNVATNASRYSPERIESEIVPHLLTAARRIGDDLAAATSGGGGYDWSS